MSSHSSSNCFLREGSRTSDLQRVTSDLQRVTSATATVAAEEDLSRLRRKEGPREEEREGLPVGSAGPSKELIGVGPAFGVERYVHLGRKKETRL